MWPGNEEPPSPKPHAQSQKWQNINSTNPCHWMSGPPDGQCVVHASWCDLTSQPTWKYNQGCTIPTKASLRRANSGESGRRYPGRYTSGGVSSSGLSRLTIPSSMKSENESSCCGCVFQRRVDLSSLQGCVPRPSSTKEPRYRLCFALLGTTLSTSRTSRTS